MLPRLAITHSRQFAQLSTLSVQSGKAVKAYILGGFGGAAGLNISQELFGAGRDFYETGCRDDGGDIRFCLDSHPGQADQSSDRNGHFTGEECEKPLIAGLERATQHLLHCPEVDRLVVGIGCNTMHIPLEGLAADGRIHPDLTIVHIVKETARQLRQIAEPDLSRNVVLWSSISTGDAGLYHTEVKKAGFDLKFPDAADAAMVEDLIEDVKCGQPNAATLKAQQILGRYGDGTIVVMGCTELPLIRDSLAREFDGKIQFVDCNQSLARGMVRECKRIAKVGSFE